MPIRDSRKNHDLQYETEPLPAHGIEPIALAIQGLVATKAMPPTPVFCGGLSALAAAEGIAHIGETKG